MAFLQTQGGSNGRNNHHNGWLHDDEFYDVLRKERYRCDRTGSSLSYVLIALNNYSEDGLIAEYEYLYLLKKLQWLITVNTREYDVKHFADYSQLGILLLDTAVSGARAYVEKLTAIMDKSNNGAANHEFQNIIRSISISTYPLDVRNKPQGVESLAGGTHLSDLHTAPLQSSMLPQYYPLKFHYALNPTPGGVIALSHTVMGDLTYSSDALYRIMKRVMDFAGALLAIVLFAPLMALIATLIALTSHGPVIYRQKRFGHLGIPFTLLKFRSMKNNCDARVHREYVQNLIEGKNDKANVGTADTPVYKLKDDPRVTWFGKFLRRTSLDELPQLFNVLAGSMSLVGPRPPLEYEVELYERWHLRRLFDVKPGITGLWQIKGRSITVFDEMVRLDLQYSNNQSIILDLKIIMQTFIAVFKSKGAL